MSHNRIFLKSGWIQAQKPPTEGKRAYFYDLKTEGLELTITPAGVKTFSAYKWVNGRPRRLTLGRFNPNALQCSEFDADPLAVLGNNPGLTLEQARQLCRAVVGDWASGQNPIDRRRATRYQVSLGELFESYIEHHAKHHTKTWKVMIYHFDKYLAHWRRRSVKEITRAEVQAFINKLGSDSGHSTANRILELFRAIINKAKEWRLVELENPAAGVRKFKIKPRKRFVRQDELPRLMRAIEQEPNEDIRDYVLISLSTGVRKSNVLSMRWEHLDLGNGVWVIPDTKNDESHEVLLTPAELAILKRRFDERTSFEWVFPGTGKTGHIVDPKRGWARILEQAGIRDLHMHDLRRTLGSYMAMSGASLSVIGNALNHKDVTTTRKVYAHTAREAERQARLNAHAMMYGGVTPGGNVVNISAKTETKGEPPDQSTHCEF